ncbi:SGNH hydrolase, partial [Auriculariales sp. MPI-PUGE-AT-0066]
LSYTRADPPLGFVLMGDSTTNHDPTLVLGWGGGFCDALQSTPVYACVNAAQNGATAAAYVNSGKLDAALASARTLVGAGRRTYVTISFGINDSKTSTLAVYASALKTMIAAVRAIKAEPILMKVVGESTHTNVVDLTGHSAWYISEIGQTAAWRLNSLPADQTHLNAKGSTLFGRMVGLFMKQFLTALPLVQNAALDTALLNGVAFY